jgi:hypothetical protein
VTQTKPVEEWVAFAERCYQAGTHVFQHVQIWKTSMPANDPKAVATLILIRTLSNFKGAITLARFKMVVEARILARCCFENLFTVVMLQEKGLTFVKQMDADREADRKARGEFLLKYGDDDLRLRAFLRQLPKSKAKVLNPKAVAAGPLERPDTPITRNCLRTRLIPAWTRSNATS